MPSLSLPLAHPHRASSVVVRVDRARTVVSELATFFLSTVCRQLPSFLPLFSVFRHVGVFGAFGGAVVFVSLVASVCCPRAPAVLCRLLCALCGCVVVWALSPCCVVSCACCSFGGLVACASGVSVFGSVAAGCPPWRCPWCVSRRSLVRFAVALAVGLCRALASSVWSLRCPFAVASCSVCGGLRVSARCVSSVGSVRSGVSLPLSGGGIAVRSERLLSRPLLSSLCAGWSGVAVAFVSWAGDRCGVLWGGASTAAGSVSRAPSPFCWRRLAWWKGLGAPLALSLWRLDPSILLSLVLVCRLPGR